MGRPRKIKERMPAPKRRSGITVAAQRRKGAGAHKVKETRNSWKKDESMELTLAEFRDEHGIVTGTDMLEALSDWAMDSTVPALCKAGCEVHPAEKCPHDQPSILLRLGMV